MKLTWHGTAALLVSQGETLIAFDPFLGIDRGEPELQGMRGKSADGLADAFEVFVTHGHFDHIIQIPEIYADGNAVIHATRTPCGTLAGRGFPVNRLDVISQGRNYFAGKIQITAYQGRHCRFDIPLVISTGLRFLKPRNLFHGLRLLKINRDYPEKGEILFYELECHRKRLQIMGSMGLDADTEYPTAADLLVLPYQGKSRPLRYAASLVERLNPKAVLLDHYDDTFPPMTTRVNTEDFENLLNKKYGIPCAAMKRGTVYDIEELTI